MMSADEMIAVIQAHKNGKMIERRPKDVRDWSDETGPVWDFFSSDYRIKPEPPKPREFWLNRYELGRPAFYGHTSLGAAEAFASMSGTRVEVIHVIEILPESQDK